MKTNLQPLENVNPFLLFAKQPEQNFSRTGNHCVIYTRVSSKEQMERLSLEAQFRESTEYAQKNKWPIAEVFGGTYESAKSDERKEYRRMLDYVKRNKHIRYIIVYSLDRFSRTGINAMGEAEKLRAKYGIELKSVKEQVNTTEPSGRMMQNIHFLFAQHDNELRRMKTVAGTREKLLRGEWCNHLPIGYEYVKEEGKTKIVLDKKYSPLIKKAFEMKAELGITDVEIKERLLALGWPSYLSHKRLCEILRNPFYCGKISSSIIPGMVVQGKHVPLISEDLFLQVHGIKNKNAHGYRHRKEDVNIPFSSFMKCAECGWSFVGYKKDKRTKDGQKSYYYYKCNKKGCKCNIQADKLHKLFTDLLGAFVYDKRLIEPLRHAMAAEIEKLTASDKKDIKELRDQLAEAEKDWKAVRSRYALGKIDESLYMENEPELRQKVEKIQAQIEAASVDYSNFSKYVDEYIQLALNLPSLWASGDCFTKENVQNFVFPEGIYYDAKNREYRTKSVNDVFGFIAGFSGVCEQKNSGFLVFNSEKSASVVPTGIEPASKV